ncbi:MAG: HAD hydrolase family protein [Acholeplasmataceae bacterium]
MPKIGLRNIKTSLAVLMTLFVYFVIHSINPETATLWYSPFFAGIAAAYSLQTDYSASFRQAKIRAIGSVFGGIYGVLIIYIYQAIFHNPIETALNVSINMFIFYMLVGLGVIPLIYATVLMKQTMATFVTILTYLSVTVSIRNNLPIEYFAANRILSTIFGVILALLINSIHFNYVKNKDILFISGLDGTLFVDQQELSGYSKHKLNHLIGQGASITIATTRTPSTLFQALNGVNFNLPMILMKGAALYDSKTYHFTKTNPIPVEENQLIVSYIKSKNKTYFAYSIYENVLTVFHGDFHNKAEKFYYDQHKMDHFKNFVKGEPYPGSEILVYMLIDLDDQIQKMETEIREFNPSNTIDIKAFPFDEQEGYSYLRLYDHKSTKFDAVNQLIDEYHFKMVIALGSKIFDIPMMQKADYSIALESAPDEVKKTADLVLKGSNPDVIVAQISKIFSMRNPQKLLKIRKSDEI